MASKGEYHCCSNCLDKRLMAQLYEELWTYGPHEAQPTSMVPLEVPEVKSISGEEFECMCFECEQNIETTKWFKCLLSNKSKVVESEDSSNNEEQVLTMANTSYESSALEVTQDDTV
ncbi:hypothetical protein M758_7G024700 [Ceratodon purpureus]|nr:hypothetical protein M758_7G024700 [Ceratodon purpureus]